MLFRAQKIKEDKLSEKISDDNPYKQKLIDMEKSVTSTPIYSFIVISLLVYIWCFLSAMIYFQAPYLKLSIFVVVFSTIGVFLSYKKNFLSSNNFNSMYYIMALIALLISIYIGIIDTGFYSYEQIIRSFLFTLGINEKSYISLSILSFLAFGISKTYPIPYSEAYYVVFSASKEINVDTKKEIKKINLCFLLFLLIFPLAVKDMFNPSVDRYGHFFKKLSVFSLWAYPEFMYFGYILNKYYSTYEKALKIKNSK